VIRLVGRVELVGGEVLEIDTGTAAIAAYERYALKHGYPMGEKAPSLIMALVVAHHALSRDESLEEWFELVDGVELKETGVPPTLPAATAGS
jgi:hypothetical protein